MVLLRKFILLTRTLPASETDGAGSNRLLSDEGNSQFRWRVQTYTSDSTVSPVYFFWLNPNGGGYTSHYFNVTAAESDASTSAQASSTNKQTTITNPATQSDPPATSSASSTSSTSSTPSSSTMPQSESASGSQTTAMPLPSAAAAPVSSVDQGASDSSATTLKVGFGVGLGVGIPLILLAGIWIGLKVVKHRRSRTRSPSPSLPLTHHHDYKDGNFGPSHPGGDTHYYRHHGGLHEAYTEPQLFEVSNHDRKPVELST